MKKRILISIIALLLFILPFILGVAISKYSPYIETNNFQTYLIIWIIISISITSILSLLLKYLYQSPQEIVIGGALLFLIVCPIIGIVGFGAQPDLSLKMLEHPEREHLRYIFLFIAAMLFGVFSLLLFRSKSLHIKNLTKWIMFAFIILAFAEFIWEFSHHYLYPEALKEWISQGKTASEFGKNYDNLNVITIGVIGRYIQFILLIWLSLLLYKLRQIKLWSPIIILIFSLLGIVSATVIYITEMNIPKGFEILFLFFIPGIPFLLLYWLGIALLTGFRKSELT